MVFLPHDPAQRAECEKIFAAIAAEEGQRVLGWRTVPTNNASLGATARLSEPFVRQVFIKRHTLSAASVLLSSLSASIVHQNVAHR